MLRLIIGNKNYSSWSMRPWVLLRQLELPFQEERVRFDSFEPDSTFKQTIARFSATGKVPILVDDAAPGGPLVVWDTLAIVEYLAERFPEHPVWPTEWNARAAARSACAEMHSGYAALRGACPMNIEARLPDVGALIWRDQAPVRNDVERLHQLWESLLQQHRGPMLFGSFSAADAYFAPVCMRLQTYGLPVSSTVAAYVERVLALPGVSAWVKDALEEQDFLPFEEPYRLHR